MAIDDCLCGMLTAALTPHLSRDAAATTAGTMVRIVGDVAMWYGRMAQHRRTCNGTENKRSARPVGALAVSESFHAHAVIR